MDEADTLSDQISIEKKGKYDFALWKKAMDNELKWESPW